MVRQGFHIGNRDWWVMVYYDIKPTNLDSVLLDLKASGANDVTKAREVLVKPNTGLTFTNYSTHSSILLISHATSPEDMFDTIVHELKHVTEHISTYYGLDPKEELSAYLQGEVGRQMFPAAALVLCPHCYEHG